MESVEPMKQAQILRELEHLAQGKHPDQQTPLMRFIRCPDWQQAAELILRALSAASRQRNVCIASAFRLCPRGGDRNAIQTFPL